MLRLTQLEPRETPATTFQPGTWAAGTTPIPGFTGTVSETYGDFDGNGSVDRAEVAGAGGSLHVIVYSGGTPGLSNVPIQDWQGNPSSINPDLGAVIFDRVLGNPDVDRMGGTIASITVPGGPAELVVAPLAGGGPVAWFINLQAGTSKTVLLGDPNYRGGVVLNDGDVTPPAGPVNQALIVTPAPGGGGGPLMTAFDADGNQLASILVGPADDRSGNYQPQPSGEAFVNGVWVQDVTNPDGSVTEWTWDGVALGTFTAQ